MPLLYFSFRISGGFPIFCISIKLINWFPSCQQKIQDNKWSEAKQKEKVNNMDLFDKATYDKLVLEALKYKLITPPILSNRLRVGILRKANVLVAPSVAAGVERDM